MDQVTSAYISPTHVTTIGDENVHWKPFQILDAARESLWCCFSFRNKGNVWAAAFYTMHLVQDEYVVVQSLLYKCWIQNCCGWKLDNKPFEFWDPIPKNATKVGMPCEAQIDFRTWTTFGSNLGSRLLQQDRIHVNLTWSSWNQWAISTIWNFEGYIDSLNTHSTVNIISIALFTGGQNRFLADQSFWWIHFGLILGAPST